MAGDGEQVFTGHKPHRKPQKGRKLDKNNSDKHKKSQEGLDPKIRNPKAFAINSAVRAERKFRRAQDHETKKDRVPLVDRSPVEAPPFVVAIVGPPKVGKSTLFTNLVKNYTRQTLTDIKGPVTIITGKKRRLTIIECNNDIHSMIDVAKVADLALLLVDASFGFEMEVFEFLNICQVHGFPQIMGVLTHLDQFRNKKKLKKTKKTLKHRFWTEVYPGAKLFYLSGYFPMTNAYPKNEVHNLARFISVMKFRPTVWRSEHSYVVADRMEDLTSLEEIRVNPKVDRRISLYGWVHGTFLKQHVSVHIPGLGDFLPDAITALPDPCPLPLKERTLRRTLNEKEKIMYAPFSGVGGIVYDQDAVYIDLGGSHSHHNNRSDTEQNVVPSKLTWMNELRELKSTLDEKMGSAGLKLFSQSDAMTNADVIEDDKQVSDSEEGETNEEEGDAEPERKFTSVVAKDGRVRRKVLFEDASTPGDEEDEEDVTNTISKEIQELKREECAKGSEGDYDSDEIENETESEEEEEEKETSVKVQGKSQLTPKKVHSSEAQESITSLVSKLKSKLKSKDTAITKEDTDARDCDVQFDDEDSDSDNEEGDDDANNIDSGDSDEEMDVDEEDANLGSEDCSDDDDVNSVDDEETLQSPSSKERPDVVLKEKEGRFSIAEEGFYSRFKNRSIQKMIYDDAEDYLNVTARADFDLANCQLTEQSKGNSEEELKELFIGGDYAETAKKLLDADGDEESDQDVFGDFEELDDEKVSKKPKLDIEEGESKSEAGVNREELKKRLKEKFDMDYDDGGGDDKSFYRDWKSQVEEQTKINRTFFEDVEDPTLLKDLQGLQPGTYVRIELSRIPCEFVVNFEPQRCCPLIVGSLDSPNQETLAVVQARVKKHRWHPKILKTRDPVIMSVGWRRFQTVALYSVQDHNMRNRMIKYTPDHLHCIANFYGPMTPQGTGILGIAPSGFEGFRITLTGTVLDMDKSSELVKKLKLVGTPSKIFKKSAFIDGMFSSQLEVAKFVGAKIKTVSGIRGVIKKELRTPVGAFRATFEDKIVQSDIVFCRTWARAEVPKFFLNLPTLIMALPRVLKTVGQLKREQQIQVQPNQDNLYTPIERQSKNFRPLKIPKSLQQKLPYKEKPKVLAKLNEPKRIAVIKDPHERQMTKFLKTLKTRMSDKEAREKLDKAKVTARREKTLKKVEENQNRRQKELRKKVFRTLGQLSKADSNPRSSGGGGGSNRPPKHRRK